MTNYLQLTDEEVILLGFGLNTSEFEDSINIFMPDKRIQLNKLKQKVKLLQQKISRKLQK